MARHDDNTLRKELQREIRGFGREFRRQLTGGWGREIKRQLTSGWGEEISRQLFGTPRARKKK